jgi:transcriptional regulator with XRE-family HTH domain
MAIMNKAEASLKLDMLCQIADFFQVSVDYLLGRIDTPQPPALYPASEKLNLSGAEMKAVKRMKELSLLKEIEENPVFNAERLHRYWMFIKKEFG